MAFGSTRLSLRIFSCNFKKPPINASGRGGHPGTYTSTGIILSTPFTTLYPCSQYGPPQLEQEPIEITYLGSAIWSYSLRTRSAILKLTVPATIMTSDWRGLPLGMTPNLSRSYPEA